MNPRYRRILIPGLLTLLLVVVLISALVKQAQGAETTPGHLVISTIEDPRITESSGLAISRIDDDLAYTINDSGNAPIVFAVEISTGDVVGTTTLQGYRLVDTEALSIDGDGKLWVADIGDNFARRDDLALYSFTEPGRASTTVTPTRWPISYDDGHHDAETLLINPSTGAKYLASKSLAGGQLYELPPELKLKEQNIASVTGIELPAFLTDGSFTPDGKSAILRTYGAAYRYDAATWKARPAIALPAQPQGETLAVLADSRGFLIGSEGRNSALTRIKPIAAPTSGPASAQQVPSAPAPKESERGTIAVVAAVVTVCLAAAGYRLHRRT